jgi:K+-transporting ATPase ATPase A chain
MTPNGVLQIGAFFAVILVVAKPMGIFLANLFEGKRTFLHPILPPIESLTYKLIGVNESTEQRWTQYSAAVLAFSVFSFLTVYLLQRLQGVLPFNPQGLAGKLVSPDLAFNTAVSF